MRNLQLLVIAAICCLSSAQLSGLYKLVNRKSGQIIYDDEGEVHNEMLDNAEQEVDNTESQWLQFTNVGSSGIYYIYNIEAFFGSTPSQLYLTDESANTEAQVTFAVQDNTHPASQKWIQIPVSGNWARYQNAYTGLYLEVYMGSIITNEAIVVNNINSSPEWERQQFSAIPQT